MMNNLSLISTWRKVLRRAWSIRLIVLAGVLSGIEAGLPYFSEDVSQGSFAIASLIVSAAAFVARIISQKDLEE